MTVHFEWLPAGRYAGSMYHDENEDAKLNKKLLGIPKERYGVSNNIVHAARSPRFSEAEFSLSDETKEIRIRALTTDVTNKRCLA